MSSEALVDLLKRKQAEMKSMTAVMALQAEIDWRVRIAHIAARAQAHGMYLERIAKDAP